MTTHLNNIIQQMPPCAQFIMALCIIIAICALIGLIYEFVTNNRD